MSNLKVHLNGRLVDRRDALVSVWDAGFQSGDAIWEGLRVYNGTIFRLDEHLERLESSAKALRIQLPMSRDGFRAILYETLRANGFDHDAHIRLMVSRGTRSTSGMDPSTADIPTVAVVAEAKPVPAEPVPQGLRTVSTRRPQPHVLNPSIHHANQLNSIIARLEVSGTGADAALMLDADGFVAEVDTANIFCVTGSIVATPHPRACLHGITRSIVLSLAAELGMAARETDLSLSDLYSSEEVFITGTLCELVPVREIDGRTIGSGRPGLAWHRLLDAYRSLVRSECPAAEHDKPVLGLATPSRS